MSRDICPVVVVLSVLVLKLNKAYSIATICKHCLLNIDSGNTLKK